MVVVVCSKLANVRWGKRLILTWEGRTVAKTLILPADENCRQHVAGNEQQQEDIMQFRVMQGIEDGQQNQASRSDSSKNDGYTGERLLCLASLRY